MLKRIVSILSCFVCSIFLTNSVAALEPGDVVMSLTPSSQDLELYPGQTYDGTVTVSNIGRLPFDVAASASPYYASDDSYDPDFEAENSYTKLQNWIKIPNPKIHLEPGAKSEVKFSVEVPADAPSGGQYAAIMLLSDPGDAADDGGMKVSAQLAAILYGHVNGGTTRIEGTLVEHSLPNFMFNSRLSASETVKNTGNIDFKVSQSLTIRDFFSNREIINQNSMSENGQMLGYTIATVLPDTTRTSIITWESAPSFGLFVMTQNISFLDQNYEFSQLVFVCPLWILVIFIALILVLIFWIIRKICAHKRKANPTFIK